MSDKPDTEPFLVTPPPAYESRTKSKWPFILGVAIAFLLLTTSWHAISLVRFNKTQVPKPETVKGSCRGKEWITHQEIRVVDPCKGLSVEHENHGGRVDIYREGHVYVEGTDKDDITVIFDLKTTSPTLADGFDVHVSNGNIVLTTDESSGQYDCLSITVTIQVPSAAIPFIHLSFPYSSIDVIESLKGRIDSFGISSAAGSITSSTSSIQTTNTSIHCTAGIITGTFILGENLIISATAGSIDVEVLVDTTIETTKATFETRADAGSTFVTLHSPLEHRNRITSRHSSKAGSVNLVYPEEWEGVVEGKTMVGSISMGGTGLVIVENGGGFVERYVKAVKGDDVKMKGSVYISGSAGSISFTV